jgi:hypothetical protein
MVKWSSLGGRPCKIGDSDSLPVEGRLEVG